MQRLLWDFRYCFRVLRKSPAFTLIIALTLALGIGANTAMFSVVNTVLLEPLPFPDSDRLVSLWSTSKGGQHVSTSFPDYREIVQQHHSFEAIAAYTHRPVNLTASEYPERLRALVVSPEFLSILRVQPALGRNFLPTESSWGAQNVVIITDRLWRRNFAADRNIIGRSVRLDGNPYSVVGVLPPDFWFLDSTDQLMVPLSFPPGYDNRSSHTLSMIARLRPGITAERAAADLAAISSSIASRIVANQGTGFGISSLQEEVVGNVRTAVLVLMAAVGFVLLIACGNLASLLMARAIVRRRETAIRTALGATPGRLMRQFLTESTALSLLGGLGGIALAYLVTRSIRLVGPNTLPRAGQIHIDAAVLLFALCASLLTGIIFAVIPAVHASKTSVNDSLKTGQGSGERAGRYRLRASLVISEMALALVLLAASGLMIRSLHLLRRVNAGFDERNVLIFNLNLPRDQYTDPDLLQGYPFPGATAKANEFLQESVERISHMQGVRAAGATSSVPLSGVSWDKVVTFYDRPLPSSVEKLPPIEYRPVVGDYFRALGIRLISGRLFDIHDNQNSQLVAIVNEELVRRYISEGSPLGKVISVNPPRELLPASFRSADYPKQQQKFIIVGVVGNARYGSLRQDAGPMVYAPYAQNAEGMLSLSFVVRTESDPLSLATAIRRQIGEMDHDLPLGTMTTMEEVVSDQIGRPVIEMFVLTAFGGMALLLAGVGVYGVMSYSIAQRTREIGIRMALGARAVDVMRMILRQGILLIALGLVFGVSGAMVLTQAMKSMIYNVGASDPVVFAGACSVLALTALMASYFPARRAIKIDPQIALRNE